MASSSQTTKWWIIIVSLVTGTLLGVYFQRFPSLEPFFRDILSAGFNVQEVDLGFAEFGFRLFLRCNPGTIAGGIAGIWAAR